MPNAEQVKKAQERREARTAGKAAAIETSAAELIEHARLSELQAKARDGDLKAAETLAVRQPPKPPVSASKAARKEQARKAAEKQADADVRVTSQIDEDDLDLTKWRERGQEVPLNILNAIAQRNDQALRDEAKELARAVGTYTYEQAVSADTRGRHARQRKIAKAIEAARQQEASNA